MNDTFPKGPGNPKHRTKDTDTRVQTMPGARNREGEHGKLVLITWRLWLGGGRGEERRQTRAVFPATVSAPPPEATGAMAPGRDPPFPLGKKGGGGHRPLGDPKDRALRRANTGRCLFHFSSSTALGYKPPAWPRAGVSLGTRRRRIFPRPGSHSFHRASRKARLPGKDPLGHANSPPPSIQPLVGRSSAGIGGMNAWADRCCPGKRKGRAWCWETASNADGVHAACWELVVAFHVECALARFGLGGDSCASTPRAPPRAPPLQRKHDEVSNVPSDDLTSKWFWGIVFQSHARGSPQGSKWRHRAREGGGGAKCGLN